MAANYTIITSQNVAANAAVVFPEAPVPCNRGLIYHRDGSGIFRLASPSAISCGCSFRSCCCCGMPVANYLVGFHGNVQIPEGGTVEEISLAIAIDGEVDPASIMTVTPAAAEELWSVGREIIVSVPWVCRCASVSVRNISTQAVDVANGTIVLDYLGIRR